MWISVAGADKTVRSRDHAPYWAHSAQSDSVASFQGAIQMSWLLYLSTYTFTRRCSATHYCASVSLSGTTVSKERWQSPHRRPFPSRGPVPPSNTWLLGPTRVCHRKGYLERFISFCTVYDTIRDAILTCARKPTWVSLIYRTEPLNQQQKV